LKRGTEDKNEGLRSFRFKLTATSVGRDVDEAFSVLLTELSLDPEKVLDEDIEFETLEALYIEPFLIGEA
jgi:hypothetical protein